MKKGLIVICLALALTIFFSQASIAESQAQDSYVTIWEKYNEAFLREADFDLDYSLQKMTELIKVYESSNDQLSRYLDTLMYYKYAKGVLAFNEGRYEEAEEWMTDCVLSEIRTGYEPSSYISFARGMILKERGDYQGAIDLLSTITGLMDYTSRRLEAMSQCRQSIKETLFPQAQSAFNNQNYDTSIDLCDAILKVLPNDAETLALLNQAKKATGTETANAQEIPIIISSVKVKDQNSIALTWEGAPETYTVSWTSDLIHGEDTGSKNVSGHEYTVTGLYPGTVYRFTVEYQGNKSLSKDKKTYQADDFVISDNSGNMSKMWTGTCVIYRYRDSRKAFTVNDIPVYKFKEQKKQISQRDKIIYLDSNDKDLILLVFTNYPVSSEYLVKKNWTLLLHIADYSTIVKKGLIGDSIVCCNPDTTAKDYSLYVILNDLLDILTEKDDIPDLIGREYSLDLLVDGRLAGSVSGMLEE